METIDITFTIKNVPKGKYDAVMKMAAEETERVTGVKIEPTHNMVIQWIDALSVEKRAASELISRIQSMYYTVHAFKQQTDN